MDRVSYAVIAILLDLTLGATPFLHLSMIDILALTSFIAGIYSLLPLREFIFTVPISLVPFFILGNSPIPLVVASILSAMGYYLESRSSPFLLTLSLSLATVDSNPLIQVLGFLTLTASLLYIKMDVRGIVVNGILFLIVAAIIYSLSPSSPLMNQFSDVAYYSLLFGVLGTAIEGRSLPRRFPRIPLLFVPFSLLTLTLGLPEAFYWWTPKSFFFRADPTSLWVSTIYFPQLNEIAGLWPLSHLTSTLGQIGVDAYIAVLVYVSGLASFLMFRGLRVRYSPLFALVYQLLSPFNHPHLLFGYSILPLTVWLMNGNVRGYVKYPAIMITSVLGSSYFLFPFQASFLGGSMNRRALWAVPAIIGANLFWIVPYSLLGFPGVGKLSNTIFLTLLLPLVLASSRFGGERKFVLLSLGSLAYMVSGLPFGEALYPVALISTLLAVREGKTLLTGLTVFLLVSASVYQFATFHPVVIPSALMKVQSQVENATLVWWNSSYPLLSPVPVNVTPLPINSIQYIVTNDSAIQNKNYTGFPTSIRVILPSHMVKVNGSWIPGTMPYLILRPNNFTYSLKSGDLLLNRTTNYVLVDSKLGEQFLDWKFSPGNSSAFSIWLSGRWIHFLPQVYLALAQNVSQNTSVTPISFNSVLVTLGKSSPILEYSSQRLSILGYATPLNLSEEFNLTLYFQNANGRLELYGEEYDGNFHPLSVISHFAWNNVTDVMLLMPLENQVEINSFSISTLIPLNLTEDWVAWTSPSTTNVTFISSHPLNGTLYVSSSVPVRLFSILVNGSVNTATSGEEVFGLKGVVVESPPGPVNVTALVMVNGEMEYYVVGRFNVSTNYTVDQKLIPGGLLEKLKTPVELNVTLVPLGNYSNVSISYYLDGKVLLNKSVILNPGNHTIMIYFSGQRLVYPSIYLSAGSFPVVFLVSLFSRRLGNLVKRLNLAEGRSETNDSSGQGTDNENSKT